MPKFVTDGMKVKKVRDAVMGYYDELNDRQHGGVAAYHAVDKIADLLQMAGNGHAHPVETDNKELQAVRDAIGGYFADLENHQHGIVAAHDALKKIERTLGMEWQQSKKANAGNASPSTIEKRDPLKPDGTGHGLA